MNIVLDEFSIAYIAMTEWIPPLFTVLVGGLLASIMFPRWQDRHARYHAREDRKLALAEELARNLTRYLVAWNRLRAIAELEVSRPEGLSNEEFERKKLFIEARNTVRNTLIDTLCSLEIYFSSSVREVAEEFMQWDEVCSTLRIRDLPPREEYLDRRKSILEKVHREISR